MPNLCPKNHDKDLVGITKQRRCRECERVRLRKQAQNRRRTTKTRFRYPDPPSRVKPATDGLEAEYGPVPDLVPDAEWYDAVIVDRVLGKQRPGRRPYLLEWAEIFRRQPRAGITDEEIGDLIGVRFDAVSAIRKALDERRTLVLAAE